MLEGDYITPAEDEDSIDQETGEVLQAAQQATQEAPALAYDYQSLLSQIQRSNDLAVLGMVGDEINTIPAGNDRIKLQAAYDERYAALNQPE
ncbi:hypothetical protein [Kerstersia gyiorum]|uniref:hypothetical protein n=1 Tax=Kerstersia gyiorum TaxID=206506 RepID=UPI0029CABA84|nr:hypothetical protein [Kerstersia gyiorum]MCP1679447.1 hypothetical protein [Kerstersia gyiorum]MCP1823950.1 hypothetical protein [Kerstersia gyiorum]MCP1827391.1 hypothetical protein [Kerstersia gyiorum]MCW2448960.1 hypothetical protein [Kerstersia gyiorum]